MKRLLTNLGMFVWFVTAAVALLWWAEIFYRLFLFFTDYHATRWENHVDDSYFPFTHFLLACFVTAGAFSGFILGKFKPLRPAIAISPAMLGVFAWLTVLIMHHTGLLIGYCEWMSRIKGFPVP